MGQQAIGQPHGRLALLGLSRAIGAPMEYTAIEIDKSAPDRGHEGRATDWTMPGSGVQADQNESCKMPADRSRGRLVAQNRAPPPSGFDQTSGVRACEPNLAALG